MYISLIFRSTSVIVDIAVENWWSNRAFADLELGTGLVLARNK